MKGVRYISPPTMRESSAFLVSFCKNKQTHVHFPVSPAAFSTEGGSFSPHRQPILQFPNTSWVSYNPLSPDTDFPGSTGTMAQSPETALSSVAI